MKTSIFLLLFISISIILPIQAQVQKGQTFFHGGVSFFSFNNRNSTDQISTNDGLTLNLGIGQLLNDKLALTLGFSYSGNKSSGFNEVFTPEQLQPNGEYLYSRAIAETKASYTTLGISLGLNHYISLRERFLMVLGSSLSATFRSNEYRQIVLGGTGFQNNSNQNDYGLQLTPGLLYFLSPRFAVNGNFGGLSLNVTPRTAQNPSSISGSFTTRGVLGIGLNYFVK